MRVVLLAIIILNAFAWYVANRGIIISINLEKRRTRMIAVVEQMREDYGDSIDLFPETTSIPQDWTVLVVDETGNVILDTSGTTAGNISEIRGIKKEHRPIMSLIRKGKLRVSFAVMDWIGGRSLGCARQTPDGQYTMIIISPLPYILF